MATNSEARKRKEEVVALNKENDPYREYYLATEESFTLSETEGVTREQWEASAERLAKASKACETLELFYD